MTALSYQLDPFPSDAKLGELVRAAWKQEPPASFAPVLSRSLVHVCAYADDRLVGYVNVATDGGVHAFLLDTTVHPAFQRRGIGAELVRRATDAARERGARWLHVDYEPRLDPFYRSCGFSPTRAGLIAL